MLKRKKTNTHQIKRMILIWRHENLNDFLLQNLTLGIKINHFIVCWPLFLKLSTKSANNANKPNPYIKKKKKKIPTSNNKIFRSLAYSNK